MSDLIVVDYLPHNLLQERIVGLTTEICRLYLRTKMHLNGKSYCVPTRQ